MLHPVNTVPSAVSTAARRNAYAPYSGYRVGAAAAAASSLASSACGEFIGQLFPEPVEEAGHDGHGFGGSARDLIM